MKITKSKEWYHKAYIIIYISAWFLCIVPTVIAGFTKLPVVATKDADSTLTGSFALALICAAYPIYKGIMKYLKSPSAPIIMWILFAGAYLLYKLSTETLGAIVVVLGVAAIGNTVGAVLFWLAKTFKKKRDFLNNGQILAQQEGDGK